MSITRRQALAAALVPAAGALAGCATVPSGRAEPLAEGVYWIAGARGLPEPGNRGRVGNTGFIVGPEGVLVIDTGVSVRQGEAVLAAVAEATAQPVRLALVSHAQQEFLFGGGAMRAHGIPLRMHHLAARLMASRCETCLKNLKATLGEEEMRGSAVIAPDQEFEAAHTLQVTGRPLQVLYFGHSSGPGDVAVFDAASGTLFAGGLVDAERIPDLQDGRLPEWREALHALRALPGLRRVVPGHGPVGGPALIDTELAYFDALETRVNTLLDAGTSLAEVTDRAELPAYRHWAGYDTLHRRNVSLVYLRLEQDKLFRMPASS